MTQKRKFEKRNRIVAAQNQAIEPLKLNVD